MTLEKKEGLDSHELKPPSPRAGPSDQDPEAAAGNTSPDEQPRQQLSAFKGLGLLDRFLALWIFLAMAIGIILGNFVPETGPALQKGKFVGVSVPIAVGLLVMMYPILCKVRYESLHELFSHREMWKQICFSIFVNWILAPFLMLSLAWAFLPDKSELRTGLILVGLGRCIAMVLIWNGLAGGNDEYYGPLRPLAVFFIRVISHESGTVDISYTVVATSVAVFLGIPLGAAVITRIVLRKVAGPDWYQQTFLKFLAPWSLIGLLYTILVLFASQGRQVVHQIVSVVRVAAPLIVYFVLIFFVTLWISRLLGFRFPVVVTQSFTAASNNFELAIAVAVATFGPNSDQALASTVGPLIEVPVLVGLVYAVRWMANRWGWK
ncbi:arsenicals resistance [Fusarium falciforme]|nr:arsenicals resistance [Fusarium falciforme]